MLAVDELAIPTLATVTPRVELLFPRPLSKAWPGNPIEFATTLTPRPGPAAGGLVVRLPEGALQLPGFYGGARFELLHARALTAA